MKRTTNSLQSGPKSIILNRKNNIPPPPRKTSSITPLKSSTTTTTTRGGGTRITKNNSTTSKKSSILLEFEPCVDFVLSILNHYELNCDLDSSDILSVLANDFNDHSRLHQIIRSLYITIYNVLIFYKFNKVSLNNDKHDVEKIIKYINYELLRLEYSRAFKLITKNDQVLCSELLNTLNWLILSHNPLLLKHILNVDYLNQNLSNGELPSDHSLYYFLKNVKNSSNSTPNEKFTTIQLIHKLIININKIFMIMSNIYNKTMQSYLLNMECENIGFTPFELNLLLLNDHSSQFYQLNSFIQSFNSIFKYYELLIFHSTFKTKVKDDDRNDDSPHDDQPPLDSLTIELLLNQLETSTESSNSLIDEFIQACENEPIIPSIHNNSSEIMDDERTISYESSTILDSVFYRLRMEQDNDTKKSTNTPSSFLSQHRHNNHQLLTNMNRQHYHLQDLESIKQLLLNAIHQQDNDEN